MRALIIAAGFGSRLGGPDASKPLALLQGVPLIEHVIKRAQAGGVTDFVVVTGHQAERVERFLHSLSNRIGIPIATVRTHDWSLPNGHSVLSGLPALGGSGLLMMADHLFDPGNIARLIAGVDPAAALSLGVDRRLGNPLVDPADVTRVCTDSQGHITAIGKEIAPWDAHDTGLFHVTPMLAEALAACIASTGSASLTHGVQYLAAHGLAQAIDLGEGWWMDVDTPADLAAAVREMAENVSKEGERNASVA